MNTKKTISILLNEHFHLAANKLPPLPGEVQWLNPLKEYEETVRITEVFLEKYYSDHHPRTLILGINPGRFGSGLTNVAFTDPAHLERECGIENSFNKREELSAQFIYKVIRAYGGVERFYGDFFLNSVVPYGFIKEGKNYNYYDDRTLQGAMEPYIKFHLESLLSMGMNSDICFCLGEGKNYKYLSKLNNREGYFGEVVPLSHPRFIMQYRRKRVDEYLQKYLEALSVVRNGV